MEFVFNFTPTHNASTSSNSEGPKVDWNAYNEYMAKTCGTQDKAETEIFIISQIIDLGEHTQEDAKMEWKGTDEEKQAVIEKAKRGESQEYFEVLPDDKGVMTEYKRWPARNQRMIAVMADNPNRMLNKGQFFGEEGEEMPMRMLLNNEWFIKGIGKVVNKMGFTTKEGRNDDGSYSLAPTNTLHKLAAAVDVLDGGKFKPQMLGKLIGKPILVEQRVHVNKVGDKQYLNEKAVFKGSVPGMMKGMIPTLDVKHMSAISFYGEQNLEHVKNLRQSVINTMMQAVDFEKSTLRQALIDTGKIKADQVAPKAESTEPDATANKPEMAPPAVVDSFDEDLPFAPIAKQEGRMFLHMI